MKTAALKGVPAPPLPLTRRMGSTATAVTANSLDTMRYKCCCLTPFVQQGLTDLSAGRFHRLILALQDIFENSNNSPQNKKRNVADFYLFIYFYSEQHMPTYDKDNTFTYSHIQITLHHCPKRPMIFFLSVVALNTKGLSTIKTHTCSACISYVYCSKQEKKEANSNQHRDVVECKGSTLGGKK